MTTDTWNNTPDHDDQIAFVEKLSADLIDRECVGELTETIEKLGLTSVLVSYVLKKDLAKAYRVLRTAADSYAHDEWDLEQIFVTK